MNEIKLLGKKVIMDKSPLLLKYSPSDDWKDYWDVKSGNWSVEDGWLIGDEPGNKGGILFSKEFYEDNVMMTFSVKTALPATRDLNAVFCAHWDDETDYLGTSYVCGLNGWFADKAGIERGASGGRMTFRSLNSLYKYTPGKEIRMTCGAVDGHTFMLVDGEIVYRV